MSGFRSGRSAVDIVIHLITCVEQGISVRKTTIAYFLDLRKPFYSIEHTAILSALSEDGIGGQIYSWIEDHLNNRTVFLDTMKGRTSPLEINRGVPQGGVLSPKLFILYLISLVHNLSEGVKIKFDVDDVCI